MRGVLVLAPPPTILDKWPSGRDQWSGKWYFLGKRHDILGTRCERIDRRSGLCVLLEFWLLPMRLHLISASLYGTYSHIYPWMARRSAATSAIAIPAPHAVGVDSGQCAERRCTLAVCGRCVPLHSGPPNIAQSRYGTNLGDQKTRQVGLSSRFAEVRTRATKDEQRTQGHAPFTSCRQTSRAEVQTSVDQPVAAWRTRPLYGHI